MLEVLRLKFQWITADLEKGDLLGKFKESKLSKVSFLKSLAKKNLSAA